MSDDDKLIKDHNYDGIQELDNPLPNWWLTTFLATIIFSFIYWIHYEFGGGQTQNQELAEDLARIESIRANAPVPEDTEEDLQALLAKNDVLEAGKSAYVGKCAACHGPELQGLIGPNLTDEYWLHGKGRALDIMAVIRNGVLEKGMPPWDGQMSHDEIKAVTAFIVSKAGSNPPNPKPPQGEKSVAN